MGFLERRRYTLYDWDTNSASFRATLASGGIKPIQLSAHSSNLKAVAERWVRSVKQECMLKLILLATPRYDMRWPSSWSIFMVSGTTQGKSNLLLFPSNEGSHSRRSKIDRLPRTPGRLAQILLPCRRSILSLRVRNQE